MSNNPNTYNPNTRYTVTVTWATVTGGSRSSTSTVTSPQEAARLFAASVAHYGEGNVTQSAYTFTAPCN